MDFQARIIDVPTFGDHSGLLGVVENNSSLPFLVKRAYFIYGVDKTITRGAHGHKSLRQLMIAVSGSFDVVLFNGAEERTFQLCNPREALLLEPGLWRTLSNFSNDAVCLVLASEVYDESDYIRDFDEFKDWTSR